MRARSRTILFCYIATIDEGDDWREEASWIKANPNFGVTVKPDYLERRAAKATKVPAAQNGFRRLHLNEWTEAAETWLTAGVWAAVQAGALDLADYRGRPAWLAVDLSSKRDLTALMVVSRALMRAATVSCSRSRGSGCRRRCPRAIRARRRRLCDLA